MLDEVRRKVIAATLRDLDPETLEGRINESLAMAEAIAEQSAELVREQQEARARYTATLAAIEQRRGIMQARCPHSATTMQLGTPYDRSWLMCDLCGMELDKRPN